MLLVREDKDYEEHLLVAPEELVPPGGDSKRSNPYADTINDRDEITLTETRNMLEKKLPTEPLKEDENKIEETVVIEE
jgi:hypothetical protein